MNAYMLIQGISNLFFISVCIKGILNMIQMVLIAV